MLKNPALAALTRFAAQSPGLIPDQGRIGIAFSGGADSTALLWAARELWGAERICALHVNHRLQASADAFAHHCAQTCRDIGLAYAEAVLQVTVAPGASVEEVAREARYRALAELAQAHHCALVLLAQHGDDQVETVLLALLRGAGPRGLAGMPAKMERHGCTFARPLLECASAELRDWLRACDVGFLDDPMNANPAFRRSRIRHELVPVLARIEPAYRRTLSRSAALCAAADRQIQERASNHLRDCLWPEGLHLATLRALGEASAGEVLRLWLRHNGQRLDRARTDELVRQIMRTERGAHRLELRLPTCVLRRQGAFLRFERGDGGQPRA
ncbi:tRNA lysidine(34) synthetase TilS [Thiomonas bhubaneswarensis]|uniref:tRNA(Ile)-lysidine synthase n=1 Tax=Thiomonas bhubaneswarensis TaxID=339866 RepID=A0A0K6HW44_9BURK|nr:tRNA lysidine(34) synthetase TilS [Thiomonas bhubaneswarensis]CUA95124.1 tRNA(Ile)-lysidine synthetase, N-terminal domain [Thiomonas bhubaneswarensis]